MVDDRTIKSAKPGNRFMVSVYPLRVQAVTVEDWLAKLEKPMARIDRRNLERCRSAHQKWWYEFYNRSWIRVTSDA